MAGKKEQPRSLLQRMKERKGDIDVAIDTASRTGKRPPKLGGAKRPAAPKKR